MRWKQREPRPGFRARFIPRTVGGFPRRETLLPLLLLSVLAPVLIGATRAFEAAFAGVPADGWPWCGLLAGLAVLYSVAGALAYGTLLEGS